jgi:hypothetical protein
VEEEEEEELRKRLGWQTGLSAFGSVPSQPLPCLIVRKVCFSRSVGDRFIGKK